jgi:hypothetical protein
MAKAICGLLLFDDAIPRCAISKIGMARLSRVPDWLAGLSQAGACRRKNYQI